MSSRLATRGVPRERDAIAKRPIGRHPVPKELGQREDGASEHPIPDQDEDERPLPGGEAENLRARVTPLCCAALGRLSLLNGSLHVSPRLGLKASKLQSRTRRQFIPTRSSVLKA